MPVNKCIPRGDDRDLKKEFCSLVEQNIGLVHACCRRLRDRGIEYEELYSAGCEGLVKAAKRFDKTRGFAFSTYAVPVILGEIKQLFRNGGTVKISRSVKELAMRIHAVQAELRATLGREPNIGEIADKTGVSRAQAAQAITAVMPVFSLSFKEDEFEIPVASHAEKSDNRIALRQALDGLDELSLGIMKLRFFDSLTQTQTAARLGMTQVQVSRLERKIIAELRSKIVNC